MTTDNVIFLAHSSPKTEPESIVLSACSTCRNKTFTVLHDRAEGFPLMKCAACGASIGRIGWAPED